MMTLESKRVVVVGGTSGLGLATARGAADLGAEVIVASGRQARVDDSLAQLPPGSIGRILDVIDDAAVDTFFAEVSELDHLVYTAGESLMLTPLAEIDIDRARSFFAIRYFGALRAVQAAASRIRPGGSITLTSGMASARPQASWSVEASVCGAVDALTRALAVELTPIRVNAISPGVVRSPLWSTMDDTDRRQLYKDAAASLPVRHVGETDEIAMAYLYCMGQTYATGTVITVDGGAVLV
jgi:NAD(P)-dependent dehydrogenase (short-subunit alcohol dehydrogenase family)